MSMRSALKVDLHKRHLYLTLGGKIVIDFWIDITRDKGFCFGPSITDRDLHLTVWEDKDKFRYHVKHKGIKAPADESPIGGQKSSELVLDRIKKMLMKRMQKYHGNKTCWTFTAGRWKRIKSVLPKVDAKGDVYVPLEFVFAELDMDFSNRKLWRKIRIRSLLTTEAYFGFLETKRGVRLIKPLSRNEMLAWPLSKVDEIQKYFSKVIGFDEFAEYLAHTDVGRKLSSQIENRVRQLGNS